MTTVIEKKEKKAYKFYWIGSRCLHWLPASISFFSRHLGTSSFARVHSSFSNRTPRRVSESSFWNIPRWKRFGKTDPNKYLPLSWSFPTSLVGTRLKSDKPVNPYEWCHLHWNWGFSGKHCRIEVRTNQISRVCQNTWRNFGFNSSTSYFYLHFLLFESWGPFVSLPCFVYWGFHKPGRQHCFTAYHVLVVYYCFVMPNTNKNYLLFLLTRLESGQIKLRIN